MLKRQVEQRQPSDIQELRDVISTEWENIQASICNKLVHLMPRRLAAVIANIVVHIQNTEKHWPKNKHFSPDHVRGVLIFEVVLFDKTGHGHIVCKYFYYLIINKWSQLIVYSHILRVYDQFCCTCKENCLFNENHKGCTHFWDILYI